MEEYAGYLGVLGLASLVCWLAALVLRGCLHVTGRWFVALSALAGAVAAVVLGVQANREISRIQLDRTAERKAAVEEKKRVKHEARRVLKERAAKIRYAEDTPQDELDAAGIKKIDNPVVAAASMEVKETVAADAGRVLPEPQLNVARRLGRLNLFAACLALAAVLFSLTLRYVQAFSRRIDHPIPLPLASSWLDHFCPWRGSVQRIKHVALEFPAFLERLARRGETFICLGGPCPIQRPHLYRFALGPLRFWKLPLRHAVPGQTLASGVLYQAAWDGKAAIVIDDEHHAEAWAAELVTFLRVRCEAQARAPRTVNVVWLGGPADLRDCQEELAVLCQLTNFRLLLPAAHEEK